MCRRQYMDVGISREKREETAPDPMTFTALTARWCQKERMTIELGGYLHQLRPSRTQQAARHDKGNRLGRNAFEAMSAAAKR